MQEAEKRAESLGQCLRDRTFRVANRGHNPASKWLLKRVGFSMAQLFYCFIIF